METKSESHSKNILLQSPMVMLFLIWLIWQSISKLRKVINGSMPIPPAKASDKKLKKQNQASKERVSICITLWSSNSGR